MRLLALALACVSLAGCATTGTRVANTMCSNRVSVEAGLQLALTRAYSITDPVKREAAISGVNISLAALTKCPQLAAAGS